jgi:hypothetical protein
MSIPITDITRLDVHPGETLLVQPPPGLDQETFARMRDTLKRCIPDGVTLLFASNDVKFSVITTPEGTES